MKSHFELMEACLAISLEKDYKSIPILVKALHHENWRVRYASAIALGDLKAEAALPSLLEELSKEDGCNLFNQPEVDIAGAAGSPFLKKPQLPEGTTDEQAEAWKRRGRIKQALCLALGEIGRASPAILEVLQRYAVDAQQDYMVRAASCHALGKIAEPSSREYLEKASNDEEFCTRLEANKALALLGKKVSTTRE